MYCNVFNVWPKTTLLLLVCPRDAKRLGTPALVQVLKIKYLHEPNFSFLFIRF